MLSTQTPKNRADSSKSFKVFEDPGEPEHPVKAPSLSRKPNTTVLSLKRSHQIAKLVLSTEHAVVKKRTRLNIPARPALGDRFMPISASTEVYHMGRRSSSFASSPTGGTPFFRGPRTTSSITTHLTPNPSLGTGNLVARNGTRRVAGGDLGPILGVNGVTGRPAARRTVMSPSLVVEARMMGDEETKEEEKERYETFLAGALGVDITSRVFNFSLPKARAETEKFKATSWIGGAGAGNYSHQIMPYTLSGHAPVTPQRKAGTRVLPITPFRVLDAPGLRDDFYCTLIAYSPVSNTFAVGLNAEIYAWNERTGAVPFHPWNAGHITSVAFSSSEGRNEILAVGRINGLLSLWKIGEPSPRAEAHHTSSVACVSWKPKVTQRYDLPGSPTRVAHVEELLVGDELGNLYYYAVQWNNGSLVPGQRPPDANIVLLKKISQHTQQICGIAWSYDGTQVATGGNDNLCVLHDIRPREAIQPARDTNDPDSEVILRYRWIHGAAVKAIAFCPWQKSLIATGGGSNDRRIHFYQSYTGEEIATIHVAAQVTSLIWGVAKKEIVATFGYANPEHPVRIAVFAWPSCQKVATIPWIEDMRALYAIPYPFRPAERRRLDRDEDAYPRTPRGDGCIVVAASDETIRFHEVWSAAPPSGAARRDGLNFEEVLR